ncbi:MAG: DUF1501 domain-containing protein [Myxococcales bacterium]|nr:DUF1501 domain-containing protein [Myxococcales bacterium]
MSKRAEQRWSRREVIRTCAAAGAGLGLFGGLDRFLSFAHAAAPAPTAKITDRYFIFCYFGGGWDVLLGLDPRDPVLFHEGNVAKTQILPGYDKQKIAVPNGAKPWEVLDASGKPQLLGPFIGGLKAQFEKKRVAIVRGMSMDTLTHEVGRRRFLTGKPPSGLLARGSSGATFLAALLGKDDVVPNLALRCESYNVDQPNYASGLKVSSVPDLIRALKTSPSALPVAVLKQVDAMLAQDSLCDGAQQSVAWMTAEQSRVKARQMAGGTLGDLFDFQAKTPVMEQLRDYYGIGAVDPAALTLGPAQAAMAVTAVTSGLSRCVSVTLESGLDTHFEEWGTVQGPRQMAGFDLVGKMMDDLASRPHPGTGDSWLDHVTFVGFSEFSRTPMLNNFMGRDHHLTNSCFVGGAGIAGGRILGASGNVAMAPQKADLLTGAVADGGEVLKPEHVYMALLHDLGVAGDPDDLRVAPLAALLKKP